MLFQISCELVITTGDGENIDEKWNPLRMAHQRYRQTTDALQTDGQCHKSNVKTTV